MLKPSDIVCSHLPNTKLSIMQQAWIMFFVTLLAKKGDSWLPALELEEVRRHGLSKPAGLDPMYATLLAGYPDQAPPKFEELARQGYFDAVEKEGRPAYVATQKLRAELAHCIAGG